jgi:hypothetical protein
MGLDMYFSTRKFGEVFYWRKANAIHAFFEREIGGIPNCKTVRIPKKTIKKLHEYCTKVLESLKNNEKIIVKETRGYRIITDPITGEDKRVEIIAEMEVYKNTETVLKYLPPQSGFFFGSLEIDDWYKRDIEETKKLCERLLSDEHKGDRFTYHAWW